MTSFCKNVIGSPSMIQENHSFYPNKNTDLKREMTSSRETVGAPGMQIIMCGYNISLIDIQKIGSKDRILK